jgi:hypothetical protein
MEHRMSLSNSTVRLALASLLCATGAAHVASAQTTFQTVHQAQTDDWGTTLEREGTGYIMAGNIQQGAQLGVIVRRTDINGNISAPGWVYTRPGGNMTAQSIRVGRDRNLLVAGEITPPNADVPNGIFLMKLDRVTGAVIWFRLYRGTPFTGLGGTVVRELQGPQGGFVLIGRLGNASNGSTGGVLITTDANGIQTCGTLYQANVAGATAACSFNDVRQNPDGSFTISGFWRNTVQAPRLPLALRVRCGQNPLWARTYMGGAVAGDLWAEGLDLALLSSPNLPPDFTALAGPWRNAQGNMAGSLQIFLNGATGIPVTQLGYRSFMEAQSVRFTPNLRTLLAGKFSTAQLPPATLLNGALMRTQAPAGAVVAVREHNNLAFPLGREFFEEAIGTPDGGASATGDAQQYTATRDQIHVKTNVNLTSPVECDQQAGVQVQPDDPTFTRVFTIVQLPPQIDFQPARSFVEGPQPDICAEIRACVPTPPGLTLWLPMDEPAGAAAANVAAPAFPGTHLNGPAPVLGQFVANSRFYDGANDYTQVNSYTGVEPAAGNFSIDAWINTQGVAPQVIANKFTQTGVGTFRGYSLYLQNGTLQAALATGGAPVVFNSGIAVPVNAWTFVAFVYNSTTNTATFYVNNSTITLAAAAAAGNKNTGPNVPFRVGSAQGAPTSVFRGNIDEVEFFRTALTPAHIASLRDARQQGKCKDSCRSGAGSYCTATQTTTNVTLWACNYGTAPTTFSWTAMGQGVGPGCSVQGPTTFAPNAGVTPVVNPGQCVPIVITVTKPAGMAAVGDTGCFSVEFTNNTTGRIFTCGGTVTQGCGIINHIATDIRNLPPFAEAPLPAASVINTTGAGAAISARVRAFPEGPNGEHLDDSYNRISLNGLPPGEPIIRNFILPPNGAGSINVQGLADVPDPVNNYRYIVEADLDGDGEWEPLSSVALRVDGEPSCDSIDFNNDGSSFDPVDIDAFLSVFSEGPCIPALNVCNDIDYNNDGSLFDPCDISSFLLVYSEGPCTPCGE